MLDNYITLARQTPSVSFLGRLGMYRYLDMDVTISEALSVCDSLDQLLEKDHADFPSFFIDPSFKLLKDGLHPVYFMSLRIHLDG